MNIRDSLKEGGWNDEIVDTFLIDPPKGVYGAEMTVEEINKFMQDWFEEYISNKADRISRIDLRLLLSKLMEANFNTLDEPFTSTLTQVTARLLGRPHARHENDHEWYALQDELAKKVLRRVHIAVSHYLAFR